MRAGVIAADLILMPAVVACNNVFSIVAWAAPNPPMLTCQLPDLLGLPSGAMVKPACSCAACATAQLE